MERLNKAWSVLVVFAIAAIIHWAFNDSKPSLTDLGTGPTSNFSLENVMTHIKKMSQQVHYTGSKGHKDVQEYIIGELKKLGLEPQLQVQREFAIGGSRTVGTTNQNILARIKGNGGKKALMLLAHYDSAIPASFGASDDISGVATILEGVRLFLSENERPYNDIIILITDAEEIGLLGARAFINHHPWIDDVGLIINLEARGSGGPSYMLMETNGKNSKLLGEFIKANPSHPAANSLMYSVYKMLPNDTDLTPFREIANINGFNFAFIGDHFDYHTALDSYDRVDPESLIHQANYVMSTLNHFAFLESLELDSEEDDIYVNFPVIRLLHYPFSWNWPLFILASIFLGLVTFVGLKQERLSLRGMGMGFLPFLVSLLVTALSAFGLWKLILVLHPQYNDILQGFSYNGYEYLAAFVALFAFIFLWCYRRWGKDQLSDKLFAPIVFWWLLNLALVMMLPGGGFLIIPLIFGILMWYLEITLEVDTKVKVAILLILSIPNLYIVAPFIKVFPVGLGLGALAAASIFLVLMAGLMMTLLNRLSILKELQYGFAGVSLTFFMIASINSGFTKDARKPNNIIYFFNAESDNSYWVTRNKVRDEFLDQFLGDSPAEGPIPLEEVAWFWRTSYHIKTENRAIELSSVESAEDSILNDQVHRRFVIKPQREVSRFAFIARDSLVLNSLYLNGTKITDVSKGDRPIVKQSLRTIASYVFPNGEDSLYIDYSHDNAMDAELYLLETSYDLLRHPEFDLQPREDWMMPFPFVDGDAIVTLQPLE